MKETTTYIKKCLELIESDHRIRRFEHIFAIGDVISRTRFYELKLNENDVIKNALAANRTKVCCTLQDKMMAMAEQGNATAAVALYKLNCTDEERECLSTNVRADVKADMNTSGDIVMGFDPKEAIRELYGRKDDEK